MTFRIETTQSGIQTIRRRIRLGGRKGRAAARRLARLSTATRRRDHYLGVLARGAARALLTMAGEHPPSGVARRVGYFSEHHGVFIEQTAHRVVTVVRSPAGDRVVDERHA